MVEYIVKRVIMALITVLVVVCITSVLMMSVPSSPFSDGKITPKQKVTMGTKHGMDDPLGIQILRYLKGVIMDRDFGISLKMQRDRPVLDIITEEFPLLAKIGVIVLIWTVVVGIPLGYLAVYSRGKWVDSVLRVVCTLGVSMPNSVMTIFLPMLFYNDGAPLKFMGINVTFDTSQGAKAYLMPYLALDLYPMCYITRLTHSSMLDALGQDHIETAWTKGLLTPRIAFKRALHNDVVPVITYLGPLAAFTLVGGFAVETVYTISGLGRYLIQFVQNRDYFIVMGTTVFPATLVIIMDLMVDILYRMMDPRIGLTKGE